MFWPYQHTVFLNQRGENMGGFSKSNLKELAAAVGLDEAQFDDCVDDGRYSTEVRVDNQEAADRQVTSTPVFFINGEMVRGAVPFEEFQRLIQAALARQ
jgi:protein-disulfide isomerase